MESYCDISKSLISTIKNNKDNQYKNLLRVSMHPATLSNFPFNRKNLARFKLSINVLIIYGIFGNLFLFSRYS